MGYPCSSHLEMDKHLACFFFDVYRRLKPCTNMGYVSESLTIRGI